MDAKTIEWIIAAPLLLLLLGVRWWAVEESKRRLDDPNDNRTVFIDQLPGMVALYAQGVFRVTIFRQSGNIHAEKIITGSAQEALRVALATFRRANIHAVHVGENSDGELRIGRLYHDHRGSNEGKKVGKATITVIERFQPTAAAEPNIIVQPVGIKCDCGERAEVPLDRIHEPRSCAACGKNATLSLQQVMQLKASADSARRELLERYRAGETDVVVTRNNKFDEET